jgi:hypothetical protein
MTGEGVKPAQQVCRAGSLIAASLWRAPGAQGPSLKRYARKGCWAAHNALDVSLAGGRYI